MIDDLISLALAEDVGSGDITAQMFCDPDARATAIIASRCNCIAAGADIAASVFLRLDPDLEVSKKASDGTKISAGGTYLHVSGRLPSILTAERTALNFAQRLCAIATKTRAFVDAVSSTKCKILDTRKTTPGFRLMEKAAVVAGGGNNHRMGLFDRVMIKDNHLAGGLERAAIVQGIDKVRRARPGILIEIEADTLDQVRLFYQIPGIDVILLDNMPVEVMRVAVAERPAGIELEASGGIDLSNVKAVAETGVDYISIGALTHSAGSIDLGLDIVQHA